MIELTYLDTETDETIIPPIISNLLSDLTMRYFLVLKFHSANDRITFLIFLYWFIYLFIQLYLCIPNKKIFLNLLYERKLFILNTHVRKMIFLNVYNYSQNMTNRQLISRMYTREKLLNYRRKFVLLSPNTSFHFVHAHTLVASSNISRV